MEGRPKACSPIRQSSSNYSQCSPCQMVFRNFSLSHHPPKERATLQLPMHLPKDGTALSVVACQAGKSSLNVNDRYTESKYCPRYKWTHWECANCKVRVFHRVSLLSVFIQEIRIKYWYLVGFADQRSFGRNWIKPQTTGLAMIRVSTLTTHMDYPDRHNMQV
jgi:hypothetical protein